jgi:hypothetical protein
MLVWNAMPSMTVMISLTLFALCEIEAIVCTTRATTSPPRVAVSRLTCASWFALRALSAV